MTLNSPRVVVAGLSGDSGKTLVALGLTAALHDGGTDVRPFKKGPDYIDAAWLTFAARTDCYNLDTFLFGNERCLSSFGGNSLGGGFSVVEGNRGLHDGMNSEGTHSTAALANLLKAPVLLVVDATKSTRTLAALVLGCQTLDPNLRFAGVVLNRVGGKRHRAVATEAIETICKIPVLGAIPKLHDSRFVPGRHLGLVPVHESGDAREVRHFAAETVAKYLDIHRVMERAGELSEPLDFDPLRPDAPMQADGLKIGVVRDGAFNFYYPDNLRALRESGAELVEIDTLSDERLPEPLHALYIGGGFPETHAAMLSGNASLRFEIREAARDGLPIYAECGGLMYLCRSVEWCGETHKMCGVFPYEIRVDDKPKGHGYSELEVTDENPFFNPKETLRGHEFHYSAIDVLSTPIGRTAFQVHRGSGVGEHRDGLMTGNVLASYTHMHALATPGWATGLVKAAQARRRGERSIWAGMPTCGPSGCPAYTATPETTSNQG